MKFLLLILSLFFLISLSIYSHNLSKNCDSCVIYLRKNFYEATTNENFNEKLEKFILKNFGHIPEKYPAKILAYYGVIQALKAKFTLNLYSKYKHVTKGLFYLNQAVILDSTSLEIRFLRFAVLDKIPAVFGIGDKRKQDLRFIYNCLLNLNFSELDYYWQTHIARFAFESGRLHKNENFNLKKLYPSISSK
jgi:hypothetical protein